MRIVEIRIGKLFNLCDYVLRLHAQDRVTIMLGVNGCGKTTLLRLVHGLVAS